MDNTNRLVKINKRMMDIEYLSISNIKSKTELEVLRTEYANLTEEFNTIINSDNVANNAKISA